MDREKQLLQAVLTIHEAALDSRRWTDVLRSVADLVDAPKACLTVDIAPGSAPSQVISHGLSEGFDESYGSYYYAVDTWAQGFFREYRQNHVGPYQVVRGGHLVSREELEKSEFYNDFCRTNEVHDILCGIIDDGGNRVSYLTCHNAPESAELGEAHDTAIATLIPHLNQALRTSATLERTHTEERLFLAAFDDMNIGIALLDGDGAVLELNRQTREIIDQQDGLQVRGRRLIASQRSSGRALTEMILAISRLAVGQLAGIREVAVQRASGKRPYIVRGTALTPQRESARPFREDALDEHVCGIVTIVDPLQTGGPDPTALERLYGLSPAEGRLTARLAAGQTLQEIAADLGTSVETARHHLKSVFLKTDTSRQAELVGRILVDFKTS